jgi:hypothetical protein
VGRSAEVMIHGSTRRGVGEEDGDMRCSSYIPVTKLQNIKINNGVWCERKGGGNTVLYRAFSAWGLMFCSCC